MRIKVLTVVLFVAALFIVFYGYQKDEAKATSDGNHPSAKTEGTLKESGKSLLVNMINTKGEKIGEAKLVQTAEGVQINLDATKIPQGTHGFHIHENGACDAPNFESAGGHFNPTNAKHGFDNPQGPHAGDLPNVEAKMYGLVTTKVVDDMVTLEKGKKNSLLGGNGTALIIHEKADDYKSQPSGNSGKRIACGVIAE